MTFDKEKRCARCGTTLFLLCLRTGQGDFLSVRASGKRNIMTSLRKIFASVCRLRQSLGFGVHSPYIYALLTDVFRERLPYYAYEAIGQLPGESPYSSGSFKINRLLFRLVNRFLPDSIIEAGDSDGRSLKSMSLARKNAVCRNIPDGHGFSTEELEQTLGDSRQLDFLFISSTNAFREAFEAALPLTGEHSVFIILSIHADKDRRMWWKAVEHDERTGFTVDLYDIGLVFFDRNHPRRNYRITYC